MNIEITIENVKNISNLNFEFSLEAGVTAIIGSNGCGKSSLMTCIAKLVYPGIFRKEFVGAYYNASNIEYKFKDQTGETIAAWVKSPNWYAHGYANMLTFKGFYEASILNGTRFNNNTLHLHNPADLKNSDTYIIDSLNHITDSNKFSNLFYNHVQMRYALQITNTLSGDTYYIDELEFSTGEYFLLSVLKQMNSVSKRTSRHMQTAILIIDEIEISLHPVAQQRFVEILKTYAQTNNVLVFIATHSLQIIEALDPNKVYLMENNRGNCLLSSPTYVGYVASRLYNYTTYDRIILVEDKLAKIFLQKIITDLGLCQRVTYNIIPIGGWQKVLEIAQGNLSNHYFNTSHVISILDGDTHANATKPKYSSLEKNFLPCANVERYVCEQMFLDPNFRSAFQAALYNNTPLNFSIPDPTGFNTDAIKGQFSTYTDEIAVLQGVTKSYAEVMLVHFVVDQLSSRSNGLITMLRSFLS